MQCIRCLRAIARPAVAAPLTTASRPTLAATQQLRSISVLSPRRPQLPWTCGAIATVPPTHASPVAAAAEAPDVLPKVSSHPALQGIQVRNGPRDTYKPTNLVRKRRHGFLSRIRTRKGRAILKRRKAKGRGTLSH
ncbi:50S ribosomal protein L34 [Lasiodiplodia hormozganensis]|uniref:Large ribosomal subunit protein bL34m n=2 Tax=Lasiodiplodia TaxID=66739 RepID=A0A5N5DKT5_9PEZI|nr:50S ribosomal protein L34 [Lasiodiplodia theobromae]KAK0625739.1 50S ribosomal protein L34 [Lasiodiplodia hormozganensis]